MSAYELINVAIISFTASFGHCLGMCGGFVIAYNMKLNNIDESKRPLYVFTYHFYRILAYVLLGACFGAFGSLFALSLKTRAYLYFALGMFLVLIGVSLLKRGKLLKMLENDKIFTSLFKTKIKKYMGLSSLKAFGVLGFLNGLIPCGIVYFFAAMAISSGNIVNSILIMLVFGICTLPALFGFSFLSRVISDNFKTAMHYVSCILMIMFGLYLSYTGFIAVNA